MEGFQRLLHLIWMFVLKSYQICLYYGNNNFIMHWEWDEIARVKLSLYKVRLKAVSVHATNNFLTR